MPVGQSAILETVQDIPAEYCSEFQRAPLTRFPSLRIIHVVSSLNVGGMEHFVVRLADAQQQCGHRVFVLALRGGPLAAEAERLGLRVRVLGGTQKALRVLRGLAALARLRPDIVHAHNPTSLHYAVLAKRVSRARVVMTDHGQGRGSVRTPSAQEWSGLDHLVAVSQAVADRVQNPALAGRTSVIHNGVDLAPARRDRAVVRAELGLGDGPVGVIVARIDSLKGHDTLLHALAQLRDQQVPLTMLIVGDGAERANRERLAEELGLDAGLVRFLGFRSDVREILAASDLFVLPSLTEGLPLSVLEAMSQGLPTIATRVGGIPELIHDGQHGLLVPPNDREALAQALARLASSPDRRQILGAAAFERARDEFSFDAMTHAYEALYARLCPRTVGAA